MAYYDALIAAWNNPVQPPPGITGTALTPSMTTDEKIVVVNEWTIISDDPTSYYTSATAIVNSIDFMEFRAIPAARQTTLLNLLGVSSNPSGNPSGDLLVGSDNASLLLPGIIIDSFPPNGPTIAALKALAKGTIHIWYASPVEDGGGGLSGPVSLNDCTAAGLV